MKKATTLIFSIFLNYAISYCQHNFASDSLEVLKTERQIVDAVIRTDTLTAASLLSEKYTYTLPDGKIISKRQYLSDIALWWRPISIEHSNQSVSIYNTTAVVLGKAKYIWRNKKGELEEANEQYTDTYLKVRSKWIRISSHASCLSGRCT
jgi:Domain of unknown function (DUF4440)